MTGRPDGRGEPTFADVLNDLRTAARPGAHRSRVDCPAAPEPVWPDESVDEETPRIPARPGPGGARGADFGLVRPYAWAEGRTRGERELRVETMVTTTDLAADRSLLTTAEYQTIARFCDRPRSVAEVAAELAMPLRVAGMVLGAMTEDGLVTVHRTAHADGSASHIALMERVLSGLRRL